MSSTELDPILGKALRLLHSKSKDSADQLKLLLDEVLKNKSKKDVKFSENTLKKQGKIGIETAVIKSSKDIKKETDKKNNEKNKNETSFLFEKKLGTNSPQTSSSSSTSSPNSGSNKSVADDKVVVKVEVDSDSATDIEEESTDAAEFASLLELACVICKQIDISTGNQLVECQECHKLYHQECHRPQVVDQDVSDPRLIWYCAKCEKSMKKVVTKQTTKGNNKSPIQTPATSPVSSSKDLTQSSKTQVKSETIIQPFKRVEPKAPVSSMSTSSNVSSYTNNKPAGLAAFAALSRSSTSTSTTKTKSSTGNSSSNDKNGSSNDKKSIKKAKISKTK